MRLKGTNYTKYLPIVKAPENFELQFLLKLTRE